MRSMDSRLTDPLGRTITLHDRTWYGHILKGHPEMRAYRRQVERTITDPTEIRLSLTDPACRLYFGRGPRALSFSRWPISTAASSKPPT